MLVRPTQGAPAAEVTRIVSLLLPLAKLKQYVHVCECMHPPPPTHPTHISNLNRARAHAPVFALAHHSDLSWANLGDCVTVRGKNSPGLCTCL